MILKIGPCLWSKNHNGVAFLSKIKFEKITTGFGKDKLNQSRIIEGDIKE